MQGTLSGRRVILGVTGSIAAYKALELLRELKKRGADVTVVLSEGAKNFIRPLSFRTLSGHKVLENAFGKMEHIDLSSADALVVAPATANFLAKASAGLADDLLTSTLQAFSGPVIICPAMNDVMYENQRGRKNTATLKRLGYLLVEPETGDLACGKKGQGRLADIPRIADAVESCFTPQDLEGKTVLVTAGPTREYLDPVRYISNDSSGRMGFAFAKNAKSRGAKVVLIHGPVPLEPPAGIRAIQVTTTAELFKAVQIEFPKADLLIAAAAPADFTVSKKPGKIRKRKSLRLSLFATPDVLAWCGARKSAGQKILGFALEFPPSLESARKKLSAKNADFIVLNTPENAGSRMASGTLVSRQGTKRIPRKEKTVFANAVLDELARRP